MASATAFDTIESAQEFLALLREAVEESKLTAESDMTQTEGRNLDALRIVFYKLEKLEQHLKVSGRLLNDLRTLRRLLLEERVTLPSQNQELTGKVA
jgi:hypothetical protein